MKYAVLEASGSTTGRHVLGATQKPVRPRVFQRKLRPTFGQGKNCVPRSTQADKRGIMEQPPHCRRCSCKTSHNRTLSASAASKSVRPTRFRRGTSTTTPTGWQSGASSLSDYPSAKPARFTMWGKKPDFPGFRAFPRDFPSFSLLWAQYGQALQIPGEANQRPLAGDLLQAAQGEAAKAHHRFDDPEDRLDRLLA